MVQLELQGNCRDRELAAQHLVVNGHRIASLSCSQCYAVYYIPWEKMEKDRSVMAARSFVLSTVVDRTGDGCVYPAFLAAFRRWAEQTGMETRRSTEGSTGALGSMSRSPTERNAVDIPGPVAAADNQRGKRSGSFGSSIGNIN